MIRALWCLWVIPQILWFNKFPPSESEGQFDLIHAHAFAAGLPAKILSWLLKIPVIYTVHGSHLMDLNTGNPKSWGEKWLLTKIKYTKEISVTKSFLKYPNINQPIAISNGVNVTLFDHMKVDKHQQFTFLYIGRDHPTKGLPILRQAFRSTKKTYPDVQLITLTGNVTGINIIKAYKQAHAFVLPSLAEGQPLVLLEAWAAKLPVIATKTTGVMELATDKQTALLVKPGSSQQLAKMMKFIYKMPPQKRQALGDAGYHLVSKDYSWAKTATKTYEVYQQAL